MPWDPTFGVSYALAGVFCCLCFSTDLVLVIFAAGASSGSESSLGFRFLD